MHTDPTPRPHRSHRSHLSFSTSPRTLLRALLLIMAAGLCAITLLSFLGRFHWAFELLTHLRLHFAGIALALMGLSIGRPRRKGRSAAALALAATSFVLNFGFVLPDVFPGLPNAASASQTDLGTEPLKILMANVLTHNEDPRPIGRLIQTERPDVIGLLEVNERWLEELRYLRGRYPYVVEDPRADNFGIVLFSRIPLIHPQTIPLGLPSLKAVTAGVNWEGHRIDLLLAHPVPPAGGHYSALRNRQFEALASLREASEADAFVLFGDLNTTPWSPHFRDLVSDTALQLASRGHGLAQTWPAELPLGLGIPIDHALLSEGLRATRFEVGGVIGSDHLPILFEVEMEGDQAK